MKKMADHFSKDVLSIDDTLISLSDLEHRVRLDLTQSKEEE